MGGLRHVYKDIQLWLSIMNYGAKDYTKPYSSQPQWQAKEKDGEYKSLDLYEIVPLKA